MRIPETEVRYSRLSLVDIGRVFWWQGRLFRAIVADSAPAVRKMFDSGLVASLVADGLLIPSWLTDYRIDGYALVVEHEVVAVPVYPREWSFSMLRDAAQLILALNNGARKFGYQTKDCNGYNVLFNRGKPVFVDLGSFVEVACRDDVLLAYEEFLLSYYYPLKIWRSAGQYFGGRVTPRAMGVLLAHEAYLRYRWPFFRLIDDASLVRGLKTLNSLRTLEHNDFTKLRVRHATWKLKILSLLKVSGLLGRPARIRNLTRAVRKMKHLTAASTWAKYHDEFNEGVVPTSTQRFDMVLEKLASIDVRSALEFAGNQGVVSRLLKRRSPHMQVICTDPDGAAIDKGYGASRVADEGVEWAIFNPFAYEGSSLEIAPEARFRSDVVVVLALTHHLTLSQNFSLDYVFDVIGEYASKYVFIEFMPLGLHDGTGAPDLPDWYDEHWFSAAFSRKFGFVERFQLEPNRILYIGTSLASHTQCRE